MNRVGYLFATLSLAVFAAVAPAHALVSHETGLALQIQTVTLKNDFDEPVIVKNLDGVAAGNKIYRFGDTCLPISEGTLTKIADDAGEVFVRYHVGRSSTLEDICPDGTIFFVSGSEWFAMTTEEINAQRDRVTRLLYQQK